MAMEFLAENMKEEVVPVVQLVNIVCCRDVDFDMVWCC